MAASQTDKFANIATITINESAANTLTFKKLETGINLMEKIAWVISRIEYMATTYFTVLDGNNDQIHMGLCVANNLTSMVTAAAYADPSLLDKIVYERTDTGTAANATLSVKPYVKDFSDLPGGGIIVPPSPLYGFVQGVGNANVNSVIIKLFYTSMIVPPADFWELVEARRIISSESYRSPPCSRLLSSAPIIPTAGRSAS
jgi:hypothetical protein